MLRTWRVKRKDPETILSVFCEGRPGDLALILVSISQLNSIPRLLLGTKLYRHTVIITNIQQLYEFPGLDEWLRHVHFMCCFQI
jgi:hypothetical protein